MKKIIFVITAVLSIASSVFASEKVIDRCEGYTPRYFVELIKIEEKGTVEYQVNMQGDVTNYRSASEAKAAFNKACITVRSWEAQ